MKTVVTGRTSQAQVTREQGDLASTLDPLRDQGLDSLNLYPVPGLTWVKLRQLITVWDDLEHDTVIYISHYPSTRIDDTTEPPLISLTGTLASATFDFCFPDSPVPRSVTISPPGMLQLERETDADTVHRWALLHHFIPTAEERSSEDEQSMAIA